MRCTRSRSDKLFTKFERRFSHLKGTALQTITKSHGRIAQEDINETDHWPYLDIRFSPLKSLGREEIDSAVYKVPSAVEWQQFRVSLKGLATKEKLYCLLWRWLHHSADLDAIEREYELIRIQNYLGALVRGGHLNSDWRVLNG